MLKENSGGDHIYKETKLVLLIISVRSNKNSKYYPRDWPGQSMYIYMFSLSRGKKTIPDMNIYILGQERKNSAERAKYTNIFTYKLFIYA